MTSSFCVAGECQILYRGRRSHNTLKGPLEPSDALVDIFCSMYESNRIRFVSWEKYTAKEVELDKESKTEHLFAMDYSGKLKVEAKKSDPVADTSNEILLQYA